MGTTCGHTTLTPNYTRITTRDAHTTGITDIEFTTGTIAIITIAIELSGWRSLSKRFLTEVLRLWPQVHKLAFALPEFDRLSGEEVSKVLNGSSPPRTERHG